MMAVRAIKNLPASVRARLLDYAGDRNEPFDLILNRYGLERLLYRLSVSEWCDQFLLKGAMLFALWHDVPNRPTRDADLLGSGPADIEQLREIFRALCVASVEEDGLVFDPDTVSVAEIRENNAYQGLRVTLVANLAGARIPLQVDVGYGDAVTPEAEHLDYPTLLDFPAPRLGTYPIYTVIAEKFEATVRFGMANTRMKDFYDLSIFSERSELNGSILAKAINATFERRGTEIPAETPVALTEEFYGDRNKALQFAAFLRKNGLDAVAPALENVAERLRELLLPAMEAARTPDNDFDRYWPAGGPWTNLN